MSKLPRQTDPKQGAAKRHWAIRGLELFWGLLFIGAILIGLLLAFDFFFMGRGHGIGTRRNTCRNNLKQIGFALHNYHDTYDCFPPAVVSDENGRAIHSWRALILPFIDRGSDQPPLQYRFDEPWDGPNNSQLAKRYASHFSCPEDRAQQTEHGQFMTSYAAIIGPGTAWPGTESVKVADFKDGTSQTILIVEIANSGIQWMEPRDLHVAQMNPTINPLTGQGISSQHTGCALVLMADGAVRYLSEKLPATTIRALLTIRGGETIDNADF